MNLWPFLVFSSDGPADGYVSKGRGSRAKLPEPGMESVPTRDNIAARVHVLLLLQHLGMGLRV